MQARSQKTLDLKSTITAKLSRRSDVVIASANLAKRYGVGEMPLSIPIDRDGRIADSHAGVVDRTTWKSEIQRLLDEKK